MAVLLCEVGKADQQGRWAACAVNARAKPVLVVLKRPGKRSKIFALPPAGLFDELLHLCFYRLGGQVPAAFLHAAVCQQGLFKFQYFVKKQMVLAGYHLAQSLSQAPRKSKIDEGREKCYQLIL